MGVLLDIFAAGSGSRAANGMGKATALSASLVPVIRRSEITVTSASRDRQRPATPPAERQVIDRNSLKQHFTLMEIVMTFTISGIVIAGAATLINSALWGNQLLRKRYSATEIAVSRIETLRSAPYQQLSQMEEEEISVDEQGNADAEGDFSRSTAVKDEADGSREVKVTVKTVWGTDHNDPLDISVSTVIADDTLLR